MYNILVVYSNEDDAGIFNSVTNWSFTEDFLILYWSPDKTTTFVSKNNIQRMTIHEVEKKG